jgi:hypothetical protein
MRGVLVSCAAAGSLLLGAAGVAASQGVAEAATADQMVCDYAFVNGICDMGQAQAGQPYEGFLDTSAHDSGEFFVASGTVPPGTLVRSQGLAGSGTILGGTPTTAGTYTFTVSGTDNNGISITPMTYQITIVGNFQPPPVTINGPSVLPSGTVGTQYANVFSVSGGSIPYTWSVQSGQLPPGLALTSDITLSQTGDHLSGTPTTAGTFTFTMQVTDGQGNHASQQFSLTIQPAHHKGGQQ